MAAGLVRPCDLLPPLACVRSIEALVDVPTYVVSRSQKET